MGFTSRLGDGFHLGLSGMPQRHAALGDDAVDGHRYAVQGGWSTDDLFANVSLSRGEYLARTAFANLDGLGKLGGTFGLRHDRAQADLGTRMEIGGLSLDPTLSLFAGALDREAHTAESAALRSEIPAFSQRYDGWKARVSLTPENWLGTGSVRWLPELNLATAQTSTDGPGELSVRQADRAGVLSFSTPATAQALPQTIHALGNRRQHRQGRGLEVARGLCGDDGGWRAGPRRRRALQAPLLGLGRQYRRGIRSQGRLSRRSGVSVRSKDGSSQTETTQRRSWDSLQIHPRSGVNLSRRMTTAWHTGAYVAWPCRS